ncbi:MAG: hypothetical protein HKN11_17950 [Rhizobiales bacterium]|nr:hypothetical protein [Hyphomicrobiales bacterium]
MFEGDHPNSHSAYNHIHLWALEWWADHHDWIDIDYRVEFVDLIFERWRGRLTGLWPYQEAGYRFYLYEALAPTVSVVAETPHGFAYDSETATLVSSPREIMSLYENRSWGANFSFDPWDVSRDKILATVEKKRGSIGKPTAQALGLQTGKLRILIEQMGLDSEVNDIRKRHKRRPAAFRAEEDMPYQFSVYEMRLPARYR